MVVKTFRGLLADGGQDHIRLSTIKGKVGYKIVKFQLYPDQAGSLSYESTVQVWKTEQAAPSTSAVTVDFTDGDLLGAAYYGQYSTISSAQQALTVVFDNEIFNQDIYLTHTNVEGSGAANSMNYYLELEVIPLDDAGAEYTTLKDMRQT